MYLSTMAHWISYIESIHHTEIDLNLERIKRVANLLSVLTPGCPVIIVGGTNGKGSTVSGLESIYQAAGYQTGTFTSPILFKQNEMVRINGLMAEDQQFCDAFSEVEAQRLDTLLTPFEFYTLAALCIFKKYDLDVWIMEVGLGGRLDAVNILEPNVAIVTSIGIDHVDWLGHTREEIGYEKAGIFRKERPAICGDEKPPYTLIQTAAEKQAVLYCQGRDFDYREVSSSDWSWSNKQISYDNLPMTSLALQNMSTAIMAVTLLQNRLPVNREAIDQGLKKISLLGRIEIREGPITQIFDVAHNPDAITFLYRKLKKIPCKGKTFAVFSMLIDKDILTSIKVIKDGIDAWFVSPLQTKRSATLEVLINAFQQAEIEKVTFFSEISRAYSEVMATAKPGDRIVVFGSFHTVSGVNAAITLNPCAHRATL